MFRNILVAIDGSAEAAAALEEAIGVARRDGARLVLISVAAPPRRLVSGLQYLPYPSDRELECAAQKVVKRAERLVPPDIPVSTVVRIGRPAVEIVARAEKGGHDLVILSSRGHGAVGRLLFGTVSRAVVRRSPVPVLIVGRRRQETRRAAGSRTRRTLGAGQPAATMTVQAERSVLGETALVLWLVVALLLELQLVLWMFDRMSGP